MDLVTQFAENFLLNFQTGKLEIELEEQTKTIMEPATSEMFAMKQSLKRFAR